MLDPPVDDFFLWQVAQFVACAHEDAVDPVRSWTDFIAIPDKLERHVSATKKMN